MRKLLLAGFAASILSLTAYQPAEARGGCGPYGHRGFYGECRPNRGGYGWRRPFYGPRYGWHRSWHRGYGWHHRHGFYGHHGWR